MAFCCVYESFTSEKLKFHSSFSFGCCNILICVLMVLALVGPSLTSILIKFVSIKFLELNIV